MKKIPVLIISCLLAAGCSQTIEPLEYVDPFVGTGFHGHTYPGASAPFGAVQLSPDTRQGNWDAASGYHYSDSTIIGFSHTHLSGTGCIDFGDILFHPTTQEILVSDDGSVYGPLYFDHKNETASAGYYSVRFPDEGIKAELTAATYSGVHRYTFDSGRESYIIVDMGHLLDNETIGLLELDITGPNEIQGMRRTQGWVEDQYIFFTAIFSEDFISAEIIDDGKFVDKAAGATGMNRQCVLYFGASTGKPVTAKVGLSIVSTENARENLLAEVPDFDFDAVKRNTERRWEDILSRITVKGGTPQQLTNFYTAMYHAHIVPNRVSDLNGEYRRHDNSIARSAEGNKRYSTFSLWDTFRAWNPLMTLTDTELVNDMIVSMLDMYKFSERKELPIWPLSSGETETMIGYHCVSVIADAYRKGIRGFDVEKAYEAMKRSSDINKKGSELYLRYGYIPSDIRKESVSCLLEFAYDDWCIAQMARELGYEEDYAHYLRRAHSYINVFDGGTGFFRGKRGDGNWQGEFNPYSPDRAFTEATPWQYRFFVPHDVNGLVQLFGSRERFTQALDSLFTADSRIEGTMVDITGLLGQYAQGNEPSHHMAYLYNYVGQPWRTQEMTRYLLDEMYHPTPEGIIGNEDCGQMSAWYIFSGLGFYPVCPGSGEFVLTTPLFEEAVVKLANGRKLTVTANNPVKNRFIHKVTLAGKEITRNYVTYEELMEGGTLEYTLGSEPDYERGTLAEDAPFSQTIHNVVSLPYTTRELDKFVDNIRVDLHCTTPGAGIYYTLDGSEPSESSIPYTEPFVITQNTVVRARGFKQTYTPSAIFEITATKAIFEHPRPAEQTVNGTNYSYYVGKVSSVYEIERSPVVASGTMPEPSITSAPDEDDFAYIFTGVIDVPEDGVYEFMTASDDGSVLYINGQKVVDNDGSHSTVTATGRIALYKGTHRYRLLYFEDYEGEHLQWGWKLPSSDTMSAIPRTALYIR